MIEKFADAVVRFVDHHPLHYAFAAFLLLIAGYYSPFSMQSWSGILGVVGWALMIAAYHRLGLLALPVMYAVFFSKLDMQFYNGTFSKVAVQQSYLFAVLLCMIFASFVIFYPDKYYRVVKHTLIAIPIIFTFVSLWVFFFGDKWGNPSMRGSLVAALMPFVFRIHHRIRYFLIPLGILAIISCQASIPILVLGAVLLRYSIGRQIGRWGIPALLATIACAPFLIPDIVDSNGRFDMYRMAINWWADSADLRNGTGLGSTMILLPYIQGRFGDSQQSIWMHSDWLQTLFEFGFQGLILSLISVGYTIYKAWRHTFLSASLMGFAAMALFNFPLHAPMHYMALAGVVWMTFALDRVRQKAYP